MSPRDTSMGGGFSRFPSTALSALLSGSGDAGGRLSRHLEGVCIRYWKPVYYFVRRAWSKSDADAKDLTQDFFTHLAEKEVLARFDAARGHFRSFLKQCLRNFLSSDARASKRIKRGGGREFISVEEWREVYGEEVPATQGPAEEEFDNDWTRELLNRSIVELEERFREQKRETTFEVFRLHDLHSGDGPRPSYDEIADVVSTARTNISNYLRAARRELRRLVLRNISEYAADEQEILREELRILGEPE